MMPYNQKGECRNTGRTHFKKGHKSWNVGLKGKGICKAPPRAFQKGQPSVFRGKKRPNISGKNHYAWKGGISSLYDRIKQSKEYKTWRRDVFIRDHYTCQDCGHRFIKIVTHHIKSFAEYKKLWFKVDNGRTLCKSCHMRIHMKGGVKKMKSILILLFMVGLIATALPVSAEEHNNVADQLGDILSGKGNTYGGVEVIKDNIWKNLGAKVWADCMLGEIDEGVQRDVRGGIRLRIKL